MRFPFRLAMPVCLGAGAAFVVLAACSSDGNSSFGANYGDLPRHDGATDGAADGDIVEISDGSTDGPKPGCTTGAVAILAGQDNIVTAAVDRGRGFAVALLTGASSKAFPALVGLGDGFLAVMANPDSNSLQFSQYSTLWSKPATFGTGSKGAPTLAVDTNSVHAVYPLGNDRHFVHNVFDGTTWVGEDQVATSATAFSFGTNSAGIAVTGQDLAWLENGSGFMGDRGLYARSHTATWGPSVTIAGAGTNGSDNFATAQVIGIEGTYDAVGFFVGHDFAQTNHVGYVLRKAADKTWSLGSPLLLDGNLATTERVNVGRTTSGDVIVTMRTTDGTGYYFRGTVSNDGVAFGAAAPIGGDTAMKVDSTPTIARGVCGDDAIMALSTGGVVQISRLRGDTWTLPATVSGASGYQVSVATIGN